MDRARRDFLAVVASATPLMAGCADTLRQSGGGEEGADGTPTPTEQSQMNADKTIAMKNRAFQTLKAEVDTGATVKWVNKDGFAHTVTSAKFHDTATSWAFNKQVSGGGSVTYTFESKGVYEYYCTIHGKSTMCGAILVGGATLEKSLPCGGGNGGGGGGGDGGY